MRSHVVERPTLYLMVRSTLKRSCFVSCQIFLLQLVYTRAKSHNILKSCHLKQKGEGVSLFQHALHLPCLALLLQPLENAKLVPQKLLHLAISSEPGEQSLAIPFNLQPLQTRGPRKRHVDLPFLKRPRQVHNDPV